MPQTSNGAGGNPWIQYMRACAANYRAGHTQHQSIDPAEVEASEKPPAKRRITKKQPEPKAVDAERKTTPGEGKPEPKAKTHKVPAARRNRP